MVSEVGSAQVSITPTMKGFRRAVSAEVDSTATESSSLFSRVFGKSTAKIGQTAGRGFKDAFSSSSAGLLDKTLRAANDEYIVSSRQLSAARLKEQDASGKIRVAETALAEARKKTGAESARSVAAEERLASAQRNLGSVQDSVRGASTRLAAAKTNLTAATSAAGESANTSSRGFRNLFSTLGNSSGVQGALSMFKNLAANVGGALVSAVETAARAFVTLGAVIGGIAAYGFIKFVKDSVGNASDLVEAGTAIGAVFGDATDQITQFAKGSAKAIGQSTIETLDAAKSFGIFGKAAGLAGKPLASFSTDFVTLAADLASFNNTSPAEAVEALGAGLRGESEPLRKYGILLDDATLKARATELGIYDGSDALTQQQRVLAAHAEILAQTSTQQGDFAKTAQGLANQQRIAAAQTKDLSTSFGSLFLPAVNSVMSYINSSVLPGFQALSDKLGAAGIAGKLDDFAKKVIEKVSGPLDKVLDTVAAIAASDAGFSFDNIKKQFTDAFPGMQGVFQVLEALAPILPAVAEAFKELAPVLADAIPELAEVLIDILPQLVPLITSLLTVISDNAEGIAIAIGLVIGGLQIVAGAFEIISDAIQGNNIEVEALLGTYGPVWAELTRVVTDEADLMSAKIRSIGGFFDELKQNIFNFSLFWASLFATIVAVVTSSGQAIGMGFASVSASAQSMASQIGVFIGQAASAVVSLPGQIVGALAGAASQLAGVGANMMAGLVRGIVGGASSVVGAIVNVASNAISAAKSALGIASPSRVFAREVGAWIPAGVAMGIDQNAYKVDDSVSSLGGTAAFSAGFGAESSSAGTRGGSIIVSLAGAVLTLMVDGNPIRAVVQEQMVQQEKQSRADQQQGWAF